MLDSRTANGATASADLSNLGIRPQDWAVNPRVVGSDQIDGVATTRIHARIDAEKLVADLSALLPKLASLGLSSSIGQLSSVIGRLPKRLPAAGQRRVAAEMHDPYVDLWTGSSDRILRKLILSFEIPAGAQTAGKVGGSRVVTLTLQYSDLNRPQTIVAPTKTQPYTALDAKVNALAQQFGVGTSSTTPSTDTTPRTDSTPHEPRAEPNRVPELTLSPYARCIANAAGDFTKMRKVRLAVKRYVDARPLTGPDHSRPTSWSSSSSSVGLVVDVLHLSRPGDSAPGTPRAAHRGGPHRPEPHRRSGPSRPPRTPPC